MADRRPSASERARVFKALADPLRVDIIDTLSAHGPMCGTELAERLDVSLALLCHHWDVLVDAGLIKKQRVGQLRMCTLDPARLRDAISGWQPALADAPERAPRKASAKKPAKRKVAGGRKAAKK